MGGVSHAGLGRGTVASGAHPSVPFLPAPMSKTTLPFSQPLFDQSFPQEHDTSFELQSLQNQCCNHLAQIISMTCPLLTFRPLQVRDRTFSLKAPFLLPP